MLFPPRVESGKSAAHYNLSCLGLNTDKRQKVFDLYVLAKVVLTWCWLIWPSGHSSVGSCHPVCSGGTPLPLSCPEPWPSSTCSRPHSCRCHCGRRSQPGCPSNKRRAHVNQFFWDDPVSEPSQAQQRCKFISKSPKSGCHSLLGCHSWLFLNWE